MDSPSSRTWILNQARVHDFFLDTMADAEDPVIPYYTRRLKRLSHTGEGPYAVSAEIECGGGDNPTLETIRARYVVGCDGARSNVRREIGLELEGDSANQAWGCDGRSGCNGLSRYPPESRCSIERRRQPASSYRGKAGTSSAFMSNSTR